LDIKKQGFCYTKVRVKGMMVSNQARCFLVWTIVTVAVSVSGCHAGKKMRHVTALSVMPFRTALDPPGPVPYCVDPLFHGYDATCWRTGPEDWNQFPAGGIEVVPDMKPLESPSQDSPSDDWEPDPNNVGPPQPEGFETPGAANFPAVEQPQLVDVPWSRVPNTHDPSEGVQTTTETGNSADDTLARPIILAPRRSYEPSPADAATNEPVVNAAKAPPMNRWPAVRQLEPLRGEQETKAASEPSPVDAAKSKPVVKAAKVPPANRWPAAKQNELQRSKEDTLPASHPERLPAVDFGQSESRNFDGFTTAILSLERLPQIPDSSDE
jgi:hypothetical protein